MSLPPAGTLLILLDHLAETLELAAETDNFLRRTVPASVAFQVFTAYTEEGAVAHISDWNEAVVNAANRLMPAGLETDPDWPRTVLSRSRSWQTAEHATVVQAMQLVDAFCDRFSVGTVGEKDLKFGIPVDAMIAIVAELAFDSGFTDSAHKDLMILGRCRKVRHLRGIDLTKDTFMSMVPVDRTSGGSSTRDDSPTPCSEIMAEIRQPFTDTFPLHMKSVLKHSGPEVAFVLPLRAIEGILSRWIAQFPKVKVNRFQKELPFDCVVRAIRAYPNSLQKAEWLIHESLKTKGRFKFSSIGKVRERLENVVKQHSLGDDVRNALESEISVTYCHLIVSTQIDRRDSRALAKGGKWITVGRLKPLMATVQTSTDTIDI